MDAKNFIKRSELKEYSKNVALWSKAVNEVDNLNRAISEMNKEIIMLMKRKIACV